jgi:MerR family transcriptional regulator/heat shock protein HspR
MAHPVNNGADRLHSIGEAARFAGVSVAMLRVYERAGLILPLRLRSRHRRYTDDDIERLHCVRRMIREEKVGIEGMRRILSLIPCWKIKDCPASARRTCPATREHGEPCWMVRKRSWLCRSAECRLCPVYRDIADCTTLKRTILRFTAASAAARP